MKNKVMFILFLLLILPTNIHALEDNISISCDNTLLKNNMETECRIQVNNLSFIATSISGQIKISDNLLILNSSYDNETWKMLDSEFSVEDINLISENKNTESNFTIARFRLKAINKNDDTGEIKFINVELGDEEYESHTINTDSLLITLKYDKQNDDIKENPSTSDLNSMIPITGIALLIAYCIYTIKKRKEYE